MAFSIPKINIGVSKKRSFFDRSHDVNTSADFGFCQPTLFDEVIPNTSINLSTNTFCRLGILPQPTFGRIQLRSYNVFVPRVDVYPAFNNLQSQQPINNGNKQYTPSMANHITNYDLFGLSFINQPCYTFWLKTDNFLPNAVFTLWTKDSVDDSFNPYYPVNITDPFVIDFIEQQFPSLFHTSHFALDNMVTELNCYGLFQFGYNLAVGEKGAVSGWPALSYSDFGYIKPDLNNSDFIFEFKTSDGKQYFMTIDLTRCGRRLFKVLNGLGYQFTYRENVCVDPLLAYYKAWFDLFQPKRTIQWNVTNAYKFIHHYYDYNFNVMYCADSSSATHHNAFHAFCYFLLELPNCCYSLDLDPFTVALTNPVQGNTVNDNLFSYLSNEDGGYSYINPEFEPYISDGNETLLQRIGLKVLPFVNKNSVIGARIEKYMQQHFGTHLEQQHLFGSTKTQVSISDVMSTADTDGGYLGEYAGKGVGAGSSERFKYEVKEHGYIIQLLCVVPLGGYSQGINPAVTRLSQFDTYQSEFDSLGMVGTPSSQLFNTRVIAERELQNFGLRPRYFDWKYKTNLRNGGFALHSQATQFMPYCLDRVFQTGDKHFDADNKPISKPFVPFSATVNDSFRFIGQTELYGFYDRIFLDQTGETDNFILHIVHNYNWRAPMLPISDSYDTFDNEGLNDDNSSISVQHA